MNNTSWCAKKKIITSTKNKNPPRSSKKSLTVSAPALEVSARPLARRGAAERARVTRVRELILRGCVHPRGPSPLVPRVKGSSYFSWLGEGGLVSLSCLFFFCFFFVQGGRKVEGGGAAAAAKKSVGR